MSKGNIKLPEFKGKGELENSIYKLLLQIIPQAEISVKDDLWKYADSKLKSNIDEVDSKVESVKKQIGSDTQNVSETIKLLREEIAQLQSRKPLDLIIHTADGKKKDIGVSHKNLPTLLNILSQHLNVYLVGPSGSGKTHAARQCAESLGVPFYFTGAIANEYKLTGYMDANGKYVTTEFRKAYENGGLFLFDEIDASFPQAVLAFNAALANDFMDFPDKQVPKHKDFYCIAAANTIGQGADRQYVGRNQLDAASLDRFVFLDWPYDENLETKLGDNLEWTKYVQKIRKVVNHFKIRHIISPRASIYGGKLLAQGVDRNIVEEMVLWKGLPQNDKIKIQNEFKPKEIIADIDGVFVKIDNNDNKIDIKNGQFVEDDECIGYVEYSDRYYSYRRQYNSINSPCKGKIKYLVEVNTQVTKGTIIATIEKVYD